MKKLKTFGRMVLSLFVVFVISCAEKLIDAPENLIPPEKMVDIINDLSVLNSARTIKTGALEENGIEPMNLVFEKYDIDSAQFVLSDRYYASRPVEYESIYSKVESRLEAENKRLKEAKKLKDSLKQIERDSAITKKYATNKINPDSQ